MRWSAVAKNPTISKPITTAVAAASAAGIPVAAAAAPPAPQPETTYTVEGGVAFSKYWQTTFPGDAASLLPSPGLDKTGGPPSSTGGLQSKNNIGGYGSFSLARTFEGNPTLDWRFSVAFFGFGPTTSSASASQPVFLGASTIPFGTNTASITENDKFSFETFDFDFGQKFVSGPVQLRAFAGLRAIHTDESFSTSVDTDKVGIFSASTSTFSQGQSQFTGVGPRLGVDFNTVGPWSLVGSVSAAFMGGDRQSQFTTTMTSVFLGQTVTGTNFSEDRASWVGNLEGILGVAWQFSPNGQVMVGYRADEWYNIRSSFSFAGFSNKQDVFTQAPFLRVTLRY